MSVLNMDCIEGMRLFPDAYFDSVVTDPPYELGFMGKAWDASGIANSVEMWREALRVLKPGGHLLAFSGSRTYHRMVCAIEDAGFEIRDQIMWVYGSGFPKSLDVSKAIDKQDAADARLDRRYRFTEWFSSICSLSKSEIDRICGTADMARHWTDCRPSGKQPDVPTRAYFEILRSHIGIVPDWVEALVDERTVESENFKARAVVGHEMMTDTSIARPACAYSAQDVADVPRRSVPITQAHTDAARQWQGWGTALKPAHEPIVVARKPLIGTVAANVLAHGTGAINVDGCRVDAPGGIASAGGTRRSGGIMGDSTPLGGWEPTHAGRWPANLIHDGSDEVLAAFPQAPGQQGDLNGQSKDRKSKGIFGDMPAARHHAARVELDKSAARFFYCAKANKTDRNGGGIVSTHPTVKPTDLMRYLCRLITPPGGTVLDPFTGSGSTGKAATLEGFGFIGFELSAEYAAIATARIAAARGTK